MMTIARSARQLARVVAFAASAGALGAQAKGKTAPVAAPVVADSFAAQPTGRQSWTSDKMRFGIGDIVTILIDESTNASANLTDNNSETKAKNLEMDFQPPGAAAAATGPTSVSANFNNNGNSQKSGQAMRQNEFKSTLSARVIAVSPTGMLKIRGHKLVNVDKNQQDVTVTGWIRPQDIAVGANTIASSRIADAEVDYGQKGALGKPRSGLLSRVVGAIWP